MPNTKIAIVKGTKPKKMRLLEPLSICRGPPFSLRRALANRRPDPGSDRCERGQTASNCALCVASTSRSLTGPGIANYKSDCPTVVPSG